MTNTRRMVAVTVVGFMVALCSSTADAQRLATRRVVDPAPAPSPFRVPRAPQTSGPALTSPLAAGPANTAPDDVLFNNALVEQAAGNMANARMHWHRLIKNHPRSRHVPSAYTAFGDHFFAKGSMAIALKFYRKVQHFRTYQHLGYVQVRVAWAELNLGRHQHALQAFFKAWSTRPASHLIPAIEQGLVISYAQIGRPQRALRFFQRINRTAAFGLMEQLAQLYAAQGKMQQAIFSFRTLIKLKPKSPAVCDWQLAVAGQFSSLGKKKKTARAAIDALRVVSAFRKRGIGVRACAARAQASAYWLASTWQREAHRVMGRAKNLKWADRIYSFYSRNFPKGTDIAKVRYFRAELLWRVAAMERKPIFAKRKWAVASTAFHLASTTPGQPRQRIAASRRASRMAAQNAARF